MYLSHYNLSEKPFQLSPDPRFLWLGETHKEALATLRYGVLENRGLLLLVGDVGTGKTTLINGLLNSLNDDITVATVFDPGLEKVEFFNFLANAFNMGRRFDTKGDFLVHFIHFLNREFAEGRQTLLIIDEAQRLSPVMLEEIRLLSNIEKQDAKLLNIFLVGQIELLDTLADKKSRAFMHRVTTNYNISPLKKTEVEEYIRFRLKVAGTEKKIFTKGAVRSVIAFSDCYPRLINTICDHALLTGYVNSKSVVDARIVNDCRKDLQIRTTHRIQKKSRPGTRTWKMGLYALIPVLLLLLAGGYYYTNYAKRLSPPKDKTVVAKGKVQDAAGQKILKSSAPTPRKVVNEPPVQVEPERPPVEKTPVKTARAEDVSESADKKSPKEQTPPAATLKEEKSPAAVPFVERADPIRYPVPDGVTKIKVPFDSVTLSNEDYARVNHLSDIAAHNPGVEILIKGYTDTTGSKRYNKNLSKFRAEFFKSYFIGRGISPARIKTFGMGPAKPIASNATREGREANRRVEIEFRK